MKKPLLLTALVLFGLQLRASAVIISFDSDNSRDTKRSRIFTRTMQLKNSTGKDFQQQNKNLNRLASNLCQLKEAEIVRWLGPKQNLQERFATRPATFALPSFDSGVFLMSGLMPLDPKLRKNHVDFYAVDDFAGVMVYYGSDGVSPLAARIYFRVDEAFPALDNWNQLKARLVWDSERLSRLQLRLPSILSRLAE